jgi:hypothetical protein
MSDQLKQDIATCIEEKNGNKALDLVQEHLADIDAADLSKLVGIALDSYNDDVLVIYKEVIGRADADLAQRLNKALGECDDIDEIATMMQEDVAVPHHSAILDAMKLDEMGDDDIGSFLAEAAGKLSNDNKIRVARAISTNDDPKTDDFVTAISTLGDTLDDQALLRVVNEMAGVDETGDEDEPDGEGGEVGEKP